MFRCAGCKKRLKETASGKMILVPIVSMLVGLIRSTSPSRVHEYSIEYYAKRTESVDYD